MTLKVVAKFEGKQTCGLENDIMSLINFHASSRRCENLHFDRIFLPKAYKGLDENIQKCFVS